MKICSITECDKKHYALTYCKKHYSLFYKYGDTNNRNIQNHDNHKRFKTHGMSNTPTYVSWQHMRSRCKSHKNYINKKITVCKRWQNSFENFVKDMGERPDNKSLDRIDNDGNYEPSNCRWATQSEQVLNQGTRLKNKVSPR